MLSHYTTAYCDTYTLYTRLYIILYTLCINALYNTIHIWIYIPTVVVHQRQRHKCVSGWTGGGTYTSYTYTKLYTYI